LCDNKNMMYMYI